jgi:hypothetical protein
MIPNDLNEFVDIGGYGGYYKIHPTEGIFSLDRLVNGNKGAKTPIKGRKLTQTLDDHGYLKVGLSKNNQLKNIRVQILLAKAFIPNPDNLPVVRHLNDIKTDNRLINLAWGTFQDNSDDCMRNGHHVVKRGEDHHWYGRSVEPPNKGIKGVGAINNKIILDQSTGVFYYGTQDASEAFCINPNTLRAMLSGHARNKTQLIYV